MTNILKILVILITFALISGQTFIWEMSILTNIAIFIGIFWTIFLLYTKEFIRFFEILLIEIAVKILDLIAYTQGYVVCKADGAILEQVYKLRHRVYLEIGYIDKEKENNIFLDVYDPFSTNLVALKNNKVIGTLRIIFYNKMTSLSTFNYFNLDIAENDMIEYVDIGRWVNDPDHRAKKIKTPILTILIGLKTYLYLLKSRKKFIIVTLKSKLKIHIEKIFNIKFTTPILLPLNSHHHKSREEIKGYFINDKEVEVCILEIKISYIWKFFYRL